MTPSRFAGTALAVAELGWFVLLVAVVVAGAVSAVEVLPVSDVPAALKALAKSFTSR